MAFRKVKVGQIYSYDPVLLDQIDGRTGLSKGDLVKVIKCAGCPPPGTMGHCHVGSPDTGKFIGLVCVNSLKPVRKNSRGEYVQIGVAS